MGQVRTYTTIGEIIQDAQCVALLNESRGGLSTRATEVYAAVLKPQFEGFAARWVGTGNAQEHVAEQPFGYVALGVLSFLAERAMRVAAIADSDDGCLIEAVLPRNLLSTQGQILVKLRNDGHQVILEAAVRVPGQMYDWGRSRRVIAKLFETVDARAASYCERDL